MYDKAFSLKHQRLILKWRERHKGSFDIALEDFMHCVENANYHKFALRILRNLNEGYGNDNYYNYWMGECYFHLGDYDKALLYFEKAKSNLGIAKVYAVKGDITKAIDIQERIVKEDKKNRGRRIYISGHDPYGGNVSVLANYYIQNGQYDNAISCEEQNEKSVFSFLNMGRAYAGKRQWHKAFKYAANAYGMNLQESSKVMVLSDLSRYSFMSNDRYRLQKYVSELIACTGTELQSAFQELTYDEKSLYLGRYSKLLTEQIPMYAYYTLSDTLTAKAYDASLMIKGALLQSEYNMRYVISESRETSLKELWEELRSDRFILKKQKEKVAAERKLNTDSLQKIIYRLEDSLIVKCKEESTLKSQVY
jgi:tetratricopeptide (TPR) repeat protein